MFHDRYQTCYFSGRNIIRVTKESPYFPVTTSLQLLDLAKERPNELAKLHRMEESFKAEEQDRFVDKFSHFLQRGVSGLQLGWVDLDLGYSPILPTCSATSANFPSAQAVGR